MAEYYDKSIAPHNSVIDMIFLSLDFEESEMIDYLKEPKLKCPAVNFKDLEGVKRALGSIYNPDEDGVPVYILIDSKGKVLSKSIEEPKEKIVELTAEKQES